MPQSTTTPRPRRPYAARVPAEQRREQLLDAALAIILRDGYDALSVDAIAREVGVTRPVIYGSFDGLGPLLGALLDRQQARALQQLGKAMPTIVELAGPGTEPAVRRMITMVREDPATWKPVLVARRDAPAAVRERIEGDRRRWVAQTEQLIKLALGTSDEDAPVMAEALLAVCEHFGQELLEAPDRFSDDQLVGLHRSLMRAFRKR